MPSNIQGMIQTIVALRELQQRDAAHKLAREQFGLQQDQSRVANAATQAQIMQQFQGMLGGTQNPQAFLPFAEQFAGNMGYKPEVIQTLIQQMVPTTQTQRSGASRKAMQNEQTAAIAGEVEATGRGPEANAQGALLAQLFGGAQQQLQGMTPEAQQPLLAGVLQRLATGQSLTDAAIDQNVLRANPAEVTQARRIGMGLAPSAAQVMQDRLGWAGQTLGYHQLVANTAMQELGRRVEMMSASAKLKKDQTEEVDKILVRRDELRQRLMTSGATLTPEGYKDMIRQLNAYAQRLRTADPTTWGPRGTHPQVDLPLNTEIGATGLFPFLGAHLRNKAR